MKTVFKFKQAQDQLSKLLSELETGLFDSLWNDPAFMQTRNWRPEKIRKTDISVTIEIEFPRLKKTDIKVTKIDSMTLQIEATKNGVEFSKQYHLSKDCDIDKTELRLEDGVLFVDIPLKKEQSPIKIFEVK